LKFIRLLDNLHTKLCTCINSQSLTHTHKAVSDNKARLLPFNTFYRSSDENVILWLRRCEQQSRSTRINSEQLAVCSWDWRRHYNISQSAGHDRQAPSQCYCWSTAWLQCIWPPTASWSPTKIVISNTFCRIKDVRCETNIQKLRRQVFCSCRSEPVEQPSSWTATSWFTSAFRCCPNETTMDTQCDAYAMSELSRPTMTNAIFSRPYYTVALMLQCRVCLSSVVCLSVTLCIVAKRCVLEQKLLLRAYRKSYTRNRLVAKWMTLTFV